MALKISNKNRKKDWQPIDSLAPKERTVVKTSHPVEPTHVEQYIQENHLATSQSFSQKNAFIIIGIFVLVALIIL